MSGMMSEFIKDCQKLVQEHGDREVVNAEGDYISVSFDLGDAEHEPAFVVE